MTDRWLTFIYESALDGTREPPTWWHLPALGQLTISRPELLKPFAEHNRRHPSAAIRAFSFVSLAYPKPLTGRGNVRLVAPFLRPSEALDASWYDLRSGDRISITTADPQGYLHPGVVPVKTYGDVARLYVNRPEAKFRGTNEAVLGRREIT